MNLILGNHTSTVHDFQLPLLLLLMFPHCLLLRHCLLLLDQARQRYHRAFFTLDLTRRNSRRTYLSRNKIHHRHCSLHTWTLHALGSIRPLTGPSPWSSRLAGAHSPATLPPHTPENYGYKESPLTKPGTERHWSFH